MRPLDFLGRSVWMCVTQKVLSFFPLRLSVCKCSKKVWQSSLSAAWGTGPVGVSALPDAFQSHNKPLSVWYIDLMHQIFFSGATYIDYGTLLKYQFGHNADRQQTNCRMWTRTLDRTGIHYALCSAHWTSKTCYSVESSVSSVQKFCSSFLNF